jgi:hypothetical protein
MVMASQLSVQCKYSGVLGGSSLRKVDLEILGESAK